MLKNSSGISLKRNQDQEMRMQTQNGQHKWAVYCYKLVTSLSFATKGLGYNL